METKLSSGTPQEEKSIPAGVKPFRKTCTIGVCVPHDEKVFWDLVNAAVIAKGPGERLAHRARPLLIELAKETAKEFGIAIPASLK